MPNPRTCLRVAIVTCAFGLVASTPLQALAQDHPPQQAAPDNSARNQSPQTTADQASQTTSDREIAQKIRQAVIADKSLSTYGHNCKIIAQRGAVTLKGPVHSDDEKKAIAAHAAAVVGPDRVTNQLTVEP